jgi:hypothetical protein
MVVGFRTTITISAYQTDVVSSNPTHVEVYSIQHYVMKFVSDLFFLGTPVSSTNKTGRHDITDILLKLALDTITKNLPEWKYWPHHKSWKVIKYNNTNWNTVKLRSLELGWVKYHGWLELIWKSRQFSLYF